jgi:hypothetical protein
MSKIIEKRGRFNEWFERISMPILIVVPVIVFSAVVLCIVIFSVPLDSNWGSVLSWMVIIAGLPVLYKVILFTSLWETKFLKWILDHGLKSNQNPDRAISERIAANPQKSFFQAREVEQKPLHKRIFEGMAENRKIWIYSLIGKPPAGGYLSSFEISNSISSHFKLSGFVRQREFRISMWCLEFETTIIPISTFVYRRFVQNIDRINTESNDFERLYHVETYSGHQTLQLLDPAMMQILIDNKLTAIEFSDSSIVLYYTMSAPKKEALDNLYDVGLKIAHQVEHNFPLGKYEKV